MSDFEVSSPDFAEELDQRFSDDITARAQRYNVWLPTALSVQYDYNFENKLFLNATALYGLRRNRVLGAELPDFLAVTPRYETKYFEVATPVSVNRFLRPGVGLGVRLWFIQIGTDNLIPYLIGDAYRLDGYFNVKIPLTNSHRCDVKINRPNWRMKDCSDPESRKGKERYKRSKTRNKEHKRNKKRQKRYGMKS